ncbi:MAG: metallophosphoesterase [Terrimicrobiaceae bacterium]
MTRRKFLRLSLKAALVTGTSGSLLTLAATFACSVNRRDITLAGLPPAFDGFRVALLSDFHHSPWVSANYIRDVVGLTNSLQPDLIALTGDYVHRGKKWVPGLMRELASLRARNGVVGVLGNHDHYENAAGTVRDGLHQAGIADLTNRGITFQRGGETLHVAGVGDYWREEQKLHRALAGSNRPESVLLLSHNPDYVERIRDDRVGLVLSGHTHGGQCVFPIIGAPILPSRYGQKYASGLCQGPVAKVFVTRGVGTAFPPIRFGCPAEVALLTLRTSNTT